MRVAFVAQPFDNMNPPVNGGSLAIWIYQIARALTRRGVSSVVFANHGHAIKATGVRCDDVDYVFTPTAANRAINRLSTLYPAPRHVPQFASPWQDLGYARQVGRRAEELDCQVILVMNYSQFVPVIKRMHPGCKVCLMMQCEWLTQISPTCISPRLADVDLVAGCSEYITRKIADAFPAYAERCVTVPNATTLSPENEDPRGAPPTDVLFVGRVSPEKGIHDLIVAFHQALLRHPEARLRIVGGFGSAPLEFLVGLSNEPHVAALRRFYSESPQNGKDPYLAHLETLAGSELGQRILFEGAVNYTQTTDFYRRALVLVNPSLSESFGMSLVEAMMHRVPVIATRVGGMPFIVDDGNSGYLVEPANPAALTRAICNILANPEKARDMGRFGRQIAESRFTWEKSADTLLQHYQMLLQ